MLAMTEESHTLVWVFMFCFCFTRCFVGCFCKCEEFKLVYKLEKSQNQLENLPSFLQSNWRKWRSLRALKNCEDRRRAAEGCGAANKVSF